ncbi:TonB-dependent receptor [Rhizobium sp. CRIBSB]|nr:TonB-dependent receptor [Rhizobium sp. CRIBSB]
MKTVCIAACLALVMAAPAMAQDAFVDEIVVTGARAIEWDPDDVPVIQLMRRADNLIVEVRVVNDTREATGRRSEITRTLQAMARAAAADPAIELSIENGGALVPLVESMVSTLTLGFDGGRSDTSVATLVVKTAIRPDDSLDSASDRIETFVDDVPLNGRSLIDISGDWQLSIIDPPRYRSEILTLIAADARQASAVFGDGYAVQIEGLSNRVTWRQAGPLQLGLFIPYDMTVTPRP